MKKNEVSFAEMKGPLGELADQCGSEENGRNRFEEFKLWLKGVFPKLLKLVCTVSVSTHKCFVMDEASLQSANIGWTGANFKRVMMGKVEENVPAREVNIHELRERSLDPEIMAEMGRAKRVTHLAHFIEMLEKQSKGQTGELKTDGSANVAYIQGTDGNFWAVYAYWDDLNHDWGVGARSVGNPDEWFAGYQFFSQV